jgi:hypothetical protein
MDIELVCRKCGKSWCFKDYAWCPRCYTIDHKIKDEHMEEVFSVDSTSDERTVNNVMRHEYRVLNSQEKANMLAVKDHGLHFVDFLSGIGQSRELSLAKTKIEEAVMWAVKHITK